MFWWVCFNLVGVGIIFFPCVGFFFRWRLRVGFLWFAWCLVPGAWLGGFFFCFGLGVCRLGVSCVSAVHVFLVLVGGFSFYLSAVGLVCWDVVVFCLLLLFSCFGIVWFVVGCSCWGCFLVVLRFLCFLWLVFFCLCVMRFLVSCLLVVWFLCCSFVLFFFLVVVGVCLVCFVFDSFGV